MFYAGRAGKAPKAQIKTKFVAAGDTCDASTLLASTHQLFSKKIPQKYLKSLSRKMPEV
jgi:hypothetical protein